MRKKWILLAVLAMGQYRALAAKQVTVEQLRQTLEAAQGVDRHDDVLVRQLVDFRLTERLTGSGLQRMVALSPGPETTRAIHAIADASTFLEPPASEISANPTPDMATQNAIMGRTINYVAHTLPQLPNFMATRATDQYLDSMRGMEQRTPALGELYLVGTYKAPIAFRDGKETDDPLRTAKKAATVKKGSEKGEKAKDAPAANAPVSGGLSSWGEFGPILGIVLLDASKGKLAWERWEQEDGKPVAEFKFAVNKSISAYHLSYFFDSRFGVEPILLKPGYHGHLEIDPETGTILRITIEAELNGEELIHRASMMVEYGKVTLGESEHFCPTRSVAISVARVISATHFQVRNVDRFLLNEVAFTDYHRFGSEATLVADSSPEPEGHDGAGEAAAAPVEAVAEAAPAAPAVAKPEPVVEKEVAVSSTDSLPDVFKGDGRTGGDAGGFTLKATTRSVDLEMIAEDKHGKPVTNLRQDEITILDNGRQQRVREFFHASSDAGAAPSAQPEPAATVPESVPLVVTNLTPAKSQPKVAPDLLILLLDESHLANLALNQARAELLRYVGATRPTARVAIYSTSELGFRVIQDVTDDHALVIAKLKAWKTHPQAQSKQEPLRPAQDTTPGIEAQVLNNINGGPNQDPDVIGTSDAELKQMGENPLRYSLGVMTALCRHFASVPGHKSLAWLSGDSVLTSWRDPSTMSKKLREETATVIERTKEALNEAHIILYVVNATVPNPGTGGFDASVINPNGVEAPIQNGPMGPRAGVGEQAQMDRGTLNIQGPIVQLAEATGGRAFNKRAELKADFDGIDRDSGSRYELGFDPDTAADGKFHTLQVSVGGRKDVALRYRTGYLYSEELAGTQERFKQAIWDAQDLPGVGLTAEAVRGADAAASQGTVKLRIRFAGLGLAEKDGRWRDQLYVFVAVRDDATQKAEVSGDTLNLALTQASYATGMPAGIPYERAVEIKSRMGSVRVIVVDANTGEIGSVTLAASALHP